MGTASAAVIGVMALAMVLGFIDNGCQCIPGFFWLILITAGAAVIGHKK